MGCTVSLISVFHFTFHVEARSQTAYLVRVVALQTNAHRDSLLYLHEIARGIVLRNQGESRSRISLRPVTPSQVAMMTV